MRHAFRRAIVLLICASYLAACYGPKPAILGQELRPPPGPNEPYTLTVTIENQNGGEGQAAVTARLRSKSSGETAAESSETVELQSHETVQVVFELRPGVAGEYDATVEVQYPPE
jgi:hypothetical protein